MEDSVILISSRNKSVGLLDFSILVDIAIYRQNVCSICIMDKVNITRRSSEKYKCNNKVRP